MRSTTAAHLPGATWHKSTHSGDEGACVEVALDVPAAIAVRDSKDPNGAVLLFPRAAWAAFSAAPPVAG